jgi:hypothetical protein
MVSWPESVRRCVAWRTHSCVLCRHSCRHLGLVKTRGVGKSADTAR